MADEEQDYELEVVDDVQWLVDEDGIEYFVDDGVRYELGEDGYAYPVGEAASSDEPAAAPETSAPAAEAPRSDEPAAAPETSTPAAEAPSTSGPDPAPPAPSGRRPLTASGPLSGPRPSGQGAFSWPSAAGAPSDQGVRDPAAQSPFSRQGEAERRGIRPDDEDQTREIRKPEPTAQGNGHAELLRLEGVRSGYGNLPVLHGVDMSVAAGQTAVMLGLNGAGKTTTAMNICGALKTWGGTITFDGQDITRWSTKKAVDAGVVMVPEGRRVFPELSVAKNLQMGGWSQRRDRTWLVEQEERVFGYFPRLRERASQLAGTLSGGEQQMLAIARGLMARPKLLIIDEASMGLAPVIVSDVFHIVGQINQDGTTVLMIEQNVAALEVADVAYVMEQGRMVRELRGEAVHDLSQVSDVLMG